MAAHRTPETNPETPARMSYTIKSLLFAAALFLAMLVALEVGRTIARRTLRSRGEGDARPSTGAVEGAVFALVGLLLAFTFTAAASRFEARRALIVRETNAIGTAWLRLDLLDAEQTGGTEEIRRAFADYVEARVLGHQRVADVESALATLARADALQQAIWRDSLVAARQVPQPYVATLVLPALNEMFDSATARVIAVQTHLPTPILVLLGGLAVLTAVLAGHSMASRGPRNWFHAIIFAGSMSIAVYTILDLEYPRFGLIRVDEADQPMIELRDSIRASVAGG